MCARACLGVLVNWKAKSKIDVPRSSVLTAIVSQHMKDVCGAIRAGVRVRAMGSYKFWESYLKKCGAKNRAGQACRMKPEPGMARCRLHGGKSTGPKTIEGRERIAAAQRLRWQKLDRSG